MSSILARIIQAISTLSLVAAVGGCQVGAVLKDGQPSAMDPGNNALRESIVVGTWSRPQATSYRATNCTYVEKMEVLNGLKSNSRVEVNIRSAKDNFMVVEKRNDKISTYLMARQGKLLDFNIDKSIYEQGADRVTSENSQNSAQSVVAKLQGAKNPNAVKDFSFRFPEYVKIPQNPGDEVALVLSAADNNIWATYTYRGVTKYRGRDAFVLDLRRTTEFHPKLGPYTIGFGVFDLTTLMPLIVVMDSGSRYRFDQEACQN